MILDLGCGSDKTAEPYQKGLNSKVVYADIQKTRFNQSFLTVKCSGEALPFKKDCFSLVYASHVLEHVFNPYQFLKECERASSHKVIIKIPAMTKQYSRMEESIGHISTWTYSSLSNLLNLVFEDFTIYPIQTKFKFPFLKKTANQIIFWITCFLSHSRITNQFLIIASSSTIKTQKKDKNQCFKIFF